jgi:hypothetical protein
MKYFFLIFNADPIGGPEEIIPLLTGTSTSMG